MRKIPATMATQHPDNALSPYWMSSGKFIDTKSEVEECFRSFSELGCGEYMWDWEGKHVDEAVMERLLERHIEYFKQNALGRDVFLTFRIPNFWLEKGYRVARAFVNIISANDLAQDHGLHAPPVFEAILPMTKSGEELYFIRKKYAELAKALKVFGETGPAGIEVIPLIEGTEHMAGADKVLEQYFKLCEADTDLKKEKLSQIRPFIARSDPALNSGLVPAILAAKLSVAKCGAFGEKHGIEVNPIIGAGSLPFRGGLTPSGVKEFCEQYRGVRTATLQPSFRYDHPLPEVKKAVEKLGTLLKKESEMPDEAEEKQLMALVRLFEERYRSTIEKIADDVNAIAKSVPSRRERRLHIGLFGYSRQVAGKHLPRAISFTCAMYSLGVPPEFVSLGWGIEQAKAKKLDGVLEKYAGTLRETAKWCGGYLNKQNLKALAAKNDGWKAVEKDVQLTEEWLGEKLGPHTAQEREHEKGTAHVLELLAKNSSATEEIEKLAEIRKSLG